MTALGVLDLSARYRAWEYSAGAVAGRTPCPVCSASWALQLVAIRPNGTHVERWVCWHDHDLHVRAGVGYCGPRRDPTSRAHHAAKVEHDRQIAADIQAGRARILSNGSVRYPDPPAPNV